MRQALLPVEVLPGKFTEEGVVGCGVHVLVFRENILLVHDAVRRQAVQCAHPRVMEREKLPVR